ncbi:MAG: glycosyltransferase family 2 protein, partial [Planctomycetota bacterium]|nr:glycosyltransferase family 2 protein [Planctomycetota bacterium]
MISVVIPLLDEQETIPVMYERLSKSAESWGMDYEIIVVDDGSTDASFALLSAIRERDPHWKLLSFARNFGHQTAISAGIHYSRGDAVVLIDGDLQDPPEVIIEFIKRWRDGNQVVYAVRRKRKENVFKRAAYWSYYRLLRLISSIEVPLDSGDFCLMDRRVVDVLKQMPERTRFVRGLRSWVGFRQVGVEYERQGRHAGEVKYTFRKLVQLAFVGILSFSSRPL